MSTDPAILIRDLSEDFDAKGNGGPFAGICAGTAERPGGGMNRGRAENVAAGLAGLCAELEARPASDPLRVHLPFAELYLVTTERWLAYLADRPERDFAWRVIPPFYRLYELHVLEALDRSLAAIAPHWRPYHWLARRIGPQAPVSAQMVLILLAARAHTHLDIGAAMRLAEAGSFGTGRPGRREMLFGRATDRVFLASARAFVAGWLAREGGLRRLELRLWSVAILLLGPLWTRALHRLRWRGYDKLAAGPDLLPSLAAGSGGGLPAK